MAQTALKCIRLQYRKEPAYLVDDLLPTGGTMKAACELVEKAGGAVVECAFIIHLAGLQGEKLLDRYRMFAMITYD